VRNVSVTAINIGVSLLIGVIKGTPGDNTYGPDPLMADPK